MGKIRRVRKIAITLILLISTVLLLGCKSMDIAKKRKLDLEDKRIRILVMDELETRYDEKFEIRRTLYDERKDKWKLEVYPKENNIENETFIIYVKKDPKERVVENYSSIKKSNLTTIYYNPIITKIFKEKKMYFWGNMGIHIYNKKEREKLMILKRKDIDFFLKTIPDKMNINIFVYIFEDVTSTEVKKEEFIKEVWELFKYLKSQNLEWASITINIYDEEFFRDKDVEHILKESNWFSSGTSEFDVFKYRRKKEYVLWIEENDYYRINTIDEIREKLLYEEGYYQK